LTDEDSDWLNQFHKKLTLQHQILKFRKEMIIFSYSNLAHVNSEGIFKVPPSETWWN
ncbi:14853_t:CDS:2, partial [Funneliformis caledonium]